LYDLAVRTLLIFATATLACAQPQTILAIDALPLTDPQSIEVLKSVCVGELSAKKKADGKIVMPCAKKCPASAGFRGADFDLEAVAVTLGHFISADSQSAVVSTEGCESHDDLWGGSYLLTQRDNNWQVAWYKSGVITERCHKVIGRDGRDRLLCVNWDGGQGFQTETIYLEDVARPQELYAEHLDRLLQAPDSVNACGGAAAGVNPLDPIAVRAYFERIEFTATGMTVLARRGQRRLTDRELNSCLHDRVPTVAPVPTQPFRIDLTFDGEKYRIAPASAAAAKQFMPYVP
jgi:hypothetical protein